jgi:K+-sensing histidine kinase KdpD
MGEVFKKIAADMVGTTGKLTVSECAILYHDDSTGFKNPIGLANLLDNAIFHNPPGTKVEVTMYQQKERWGILLSDNGCGMDEETLSDCLNGITAAQIRPEAAK